MSTSSARRTLRLVVAVPSLNRGGAEKFAAELAAHVDTSKFEVGVLITRGYGGGPLRRMLDAHGVEVVVAGRSSWFRSWLSSSAALLRMRPDVLHTNLSSLMHVSGAFPFLGSAVRKVHTLHNMPGVVESRLSLRVSSILLRAGRVRVVAISRSMLRAASEALKLIPTDIALVANGVNLEMFKPSSEYVVDQEGFRVVAVGSLTEVKAHEDLLAAFAMLKPRTLENSVLTIVGGGPLREALSEVIATLGLRGRVHLVGPVDDVIPYLHAADVFVSSSLSEGLPLSLLEALSTGLPVVVTEVGGVTDVIRDGVHGILVPPREPGKLATALEALASDANRRRKMGRQARRRAQAFSLGNCVRAYEELYSYDAVEGGSHDESRPFGRGSSGI